jgi:hypothetical protein
MAVRPTSRRGGSRPGAGFALDKAAAFIERAAGDGAKDER